MASWHGQDWALRILFALPGGDEALRSDVRGETALTVAVDKQNEACISTIDALFPQSEIRRQAAALKESKLQKELDDGLKALDRKSARFQQRAAQPVAGAGARVGVGEGIVGAGREVGAELDLCC